MGNLILAWFANSLTLYILARFLSGITVNNLHSTEGIITVIMGGAVMGILNAVVKPVLSFLSTPITWLTLGLFNLVISGIIFYLMIRFTPGFYVVNFWWALAGGVAFGIINSILNSILGIEEKKKDKD